MLLVRLHWHRDQQWQQRIHEVLLWRIEEALPGVPAEEDECEVTEAGICVAATWGATWPAESKAR
eukprot:10301060-Alexandrium_andersonii.AAC.1